MFKKKFYIVLFFYHLIFVISSYFFVQFHGGDSHLYWGKTTYFQNHSWFDFANYGADFILFLNNPFITFGLPFWFGFLLYGIIGFFGILKWIQWSELVVQDTLTYKGFNFLYLLFFLPNLHVWTSIIGKEPFVFWGIASVIYAVTTQRYLTFSAIAGSLLVLLIRPHVALMLLSAIVLVFIFQKQYSLKRRISIAAIFSLVFLVLLYMVFQLSNIRYWDWERIAYFNDYSILSFRHSGSYVPMLDYPYYYKLFSFHFRPLFFDANSTLAIFASIENTVVLVIFVLALFFGIRFYNKVKYTKEMKTVFLFTFIATIIYVERYANLGIFMRTKMMFQPFMIVALLLIISKGFSILFVTLKSETKHSK
jgi:hypothetical protein